MEVTVIMARKRFSDEDVIRVPVSALCSLHGRLRWGDFKPLSFHQLPAS